MDSKKQRLKELYEKRDKYEDKAENIAFLANKHRIREKELNVFKGIFDFAGYYKYMDRKK